MSEQAATYYAELLQLPAEKAAALVEPVQVYGPPLDAALGVRQLDARLVEEQMEKRLKAATLPLICTVGSQLPQLDGVAFRSYDGHPSFKGLRRALLGRKFVTGQLLELTLRPVAPLELPPGTRLRFDHLAANPLPTHRLVEGHDVYYQAAARLKAGGRLAVMACAAHAAPFVRRKLNKHYGQQTPNGEMIARVEFLPLDYEQLDAEDELFQGHRQSSGPIASSW